jgi:eukaryotic-like serine/threonine-protein kinase
MELAPETMLNQRYQIVRKLGQGGMGAVYLARDISLDHEVAVKVNQNPAAEGVNQFLREARLLAALRHANLPRVTDYFILDSSQYLVMDYIPGKDLDALLEGKGPLPVEQVMAWAQQLGSALSYMHRQTPPVIHRDIKPGNIKLTADGEAVLVDFGIAKATPTDQATETAARSYTPGYAPPEQYGGGRTSPLSDQYALAATLYTLLSGQKPSDAIQRVLGQAVLTPLGVLAPQAPPWVAAAIERALAVRPEERFANVNEFVQALANPTFVAIPPSSVPVQPAANATIRPSDPTVAVPRSAIPALEIAPVKKRSARGWWIAGGVVVVLGLAVLGVGGFFVLNTFNRPTATAAPTIVPTIVIATPTAQQAVVLPSATAAQVVPTSTIPPLPTDTLAPQPSATAQALVPTLLPLGRGGVIVFASDRADGKTLQLWRMAAALNDQGQVVVSDVKQLTQGEGDKTQPRWSPDGSEILYVASAGKELGLDIWKMKADGSEPAVDVTKRKGDDTDPAWSPDGKTIAFTNNGREDGVRQLFLINADGTGTYKLSFDQQEFEATWAPDMHALASVLSSKGLQILFVRAPTQAETSPDASPKPYYVTPQHFDFTSVSGSMGIVAQPAWSPDGNWIAYVRIDGTRKRIYMARSPLKNAGQDIIKLTDGNLDEAPAWSADSQWIAFTSNRDGNSEIYGMRSTGQSQTNLTNSPGRDQDANWKPATN